MSHWQDILAVLLCLAASGYIGYRAWRTLAGRKAAGCGTGCGNCSTPAKPGAMLQIDSQPASGKGERGA